MFVFLSNGLVVIFFGLFTFIGVLIGWILHEELNKHGTRHHQCTQECCDRSVEERQVDNDHHGMGSSQETQTAEQRD